MCGKVGQFEQVDLLGFVGATIVEKKLSNEGGLAVWGACAVGE